MSDWAAVDDLIRELGSVRYAADQMRASGAAKAALDAAIHAAALAVSHTTSSPRDRGRLMSARDAIGVAEEVIIALDAEVGRSLRVRARAEALRERAAALIRANGA